MSHTGKSPCSPFSRDRDSKWWCPMGACWVMFLKPPLILDGYMLNDLNHSKNHVCNLWRSPCGLPFKHLLDLYISSCDCAHGLVNGDTHTLMPCADPLRYQSRMTALIILSLYLLFFVGLSSKWILCICGVRRSSELRKYQISQSEIPSGDVQCGKSHLEIRGFEKHIGNGKVTSPTGKAIL